MFNNKEVAELGYAKVHALRTLFEKYNIDCSKLDNLELLEVMGYYKNEFVKDIFVLSDNSKIICDGKAVKLQANTNSHNEEKIKLIVLLSESMGLKTVVFDGPKDFLLQAWTMCIAMGQAPRPLQGQVTLFFEFMDQIKNNIPKESAMELDGAMSQLKSVAKLLKL